jgi:hypothetical protein
LPPGFVLDAPPRPRNSRTGGLPPAALDTDDNISDLARADDAQRNAPGFEDMAPDADAKGPSNQPASEVASPLTREESQRQNDADAARSPVAARLKVALGQQGASPQQIATGMNQGRADLNAAAGAVVTGVGQAIQGVGNIASRTELSMARGVEAQAQRSLNILDQIDQGRPLTNLEDPAGLRFATPDDRAQLRQHLTGMLNPAAQPPNAAMRAGQAVEQFGQSGFPVPKENEGLGTGVARTAAGVALPVAAGMLAGPAAAAAVFYPQSFQAHYEEAKAKGASDDTATAAAHAGAAADTAVMAVPLHQALNYVPAPLKEGFARIAADLVKAGATFSGASALDTVAQNYVAQKTFDPNRPLLQGVATAAAEGAIAGPIVHTGVGAVGAAAAHVADVMAPSASPAFFANLQRLYDIAADRRLGSTAPPPAESPAESQSAPPPPEHTPPQLPAADVDAAPPAASAASPPTIATETESPPAPTTSPYVMVRPSDVALDPRRFQYKESDPETGVNGALSGVQRWDAGLADPIDLYRDTDGTLYVVNGHQRTDLARRAEAAGQPDVMMPAKIHDAADGYTPENMRLMAAYKNIAQGSGTAIDAAKIMRAQPPEGFVPPDLPPRSAMVQQGQGLSKLSDEAFGAVVNGVVPAPYAAEVGRMISDPTQQVAAIRLLHQAEPANVEQARIMVQDVRNAGFLSGSQDDMFGSQAFAQSLFPERAKVLAQAMQNLRGNKRVFQAAVSGEDALTEAGNKMDTAANQKGQTENERIIDILQRTATTHGPISDALTAAARDVAAGKATRGAAADFLGKTRTLIRNGQGVGLERGADFVGTGEAGEGQAHGEPAGVGPPQEGPGLFSSREGATTPAPDDQLEARNAEDLHAAMRDLMRTAGLPPTVALRLQERIGAAGPDGRGTADGHYLHGLITFALDTAPSDIPTKLFHEIVHALRDPALGLLKPGEREALDQAARKWLRQGTNRADIERRYGNDASLVHEEAIARLAEQALSKAMSQPGYITRLADRMVNFVRGLGQALRGRGFKTADDVFRSIMRGQRTGERVPEPAAPMPDVEPQFAKRPVRIDDKAGLEREGQAYMFGRSAVQAQAARDAGPNTGRVPQKPAEEGVFAPRDEGRQADMLTAQDDTALSSQPDAGGSSVNRPPPDKGGQGRLFSLRDQEKVAGLDGFYSGVARAALDMKQGKGTGEQMLAMLQKAPGVKPEEMKWLGLPEWLRGQKSVTRDDIVNYVRANSLVAKETVLGYPNRIKPLERRLRAAGITKPLDEISLNDLQRSNADQELYDDFSDALFGRKEDRPTVYSRYKREGGEDYRELLISLPPSSREDGLSYRAEHWGEPNVIAHTRFDERIGADGKRTLLVHEIQSDWHQKGRRKGYRPSADERKALDERYKEISDEYIAAREVGREISAETRLEWAGIHDLLMDPKGVPDAPFKTSWPMLTMKRLIKWAVDNNFDRVAWEPGQVQADRYKLSKQVGRLDYIPTTNELSAYDSRGEFILNFSDATPDRLSKLIGKETAQKLLAQQELPLPYSRSPRKQLTVTDLKLGGEGMKGFYDEILPKETQKLIGKYGAQVKRSDVSKGWVHDPADYFHPLATGEDGSYRVVDGRGDDYNGTGRYSHDDAYALADRVNHEIRGREVFETHSFDITPAMRAAVTQDGLPLFSLRDDGRDPAVRERDRINLALNLTQPRGRASLEPIHAVARNVLEILSPTSLPGAKPNERIVRRHAADLARSFARTVADLSDMRDALNRLPVDEQLAFTDRMEAGERQATPELQAVADMLRKSYDAWAARIQSLGKGYLERTIENYAPHIWGNYQEWSKGLPQDPDADPMQHAAAAGLSKSPIRGSGAFLKKRTFETQRAGMDAGLVPVSTNPIDMAMIKLREMQKMYHGTRMADEMKATGIAQWVPVGGEGEARNAGWVALDDRVFQPTIREDGAEKRYGTWYAPEEAARIFNNYTSRGWSGNPVYDVVRASGNALNQMQLGMSGFHATFVTIDSAISASALGIRQVSRGVARGDIGTIAKGAGNIALGATPFVGTLAAAARTTARGSALRKAILYPEAASPELRRIADLGMTAGVRVGQQQIFRAEASGSFVRNLKDFTNGHVFREILATIRDTPLTSPFRLAGRLTETMAEPLMAVYVPRAKLGVFYDMASDWTEANPEATPEATADAMIKAWDSVDNRMGQMVYDNLFWNKTLKDLAFVTTRSVGWNLGTIRELGGAPIDTIEQVARLAQRKPADVTHRMAYAMAMPMVYGILGGTMTYLFTGQPPKEMLDYFYPRKSDGTRLSMPGYIKDVVDFYNAPLQTSANKLHPLLSMGQQLANNHDYYGGIIYDPQLDNFGRAYMEYLLNQAVPFSLRAIAKENAEGSTPWEKAAAFFGFQPGPAWTTNPGAAEAWQMRDNARAYRKRLREPNRILLPYGN